MTTRALVLVAIAALALGYGVSRAPGFFGATEPPANAPSIDESSQQLPPEPGRTGAVARPPPHGASTAESQRPEAPAQRRQVATEPDTVAPPIDPGPFWDSDAVVTTDVTPDEVDPIDIGPPIDADDPSDWDLNQAPGEPIEIGTFLDAGGTPEP